MRRTGQVVRCGAKAGVNHFGDTRSAMEFLKRIFIWWHDSTIGTSFTLWRRGARLVGEDEQGNKYYEEGGKPSFPDGRRRRWVVFHGVAEGSRVPPEWYGWMHHTFDAPPSEAPFPRKKFETTYLPNMTGTPLAYRPTGSLVHSEKRDKVFEPYEAWRPEDA